MITIELFLLVQSNASFSLSFALEYSVAYDVKVNSKAEMKTMSKKMTSTFSDSQTFTKEMQQTMTTNNVESVSPNTITADTSATPAEVDTRGKDNSINNDDTTKPTPDDKIDAGVIAAAVLVPLLVIAAIVGGFVWYRSNQKETKLEKHATEMVEQRHHDAMNNNPVHTGSTVQKTPSVELFERKGSMNSTNPLANHTDKMRELDI